MSLLSILSDHQVRYPAMQARDVDKLLHQADCGPAHLVTNSEDARNWL